MSLEETHFQKLANTEFLERFKKDYEGGTNYYSVEEITIKETTCKASTNNEYCYPKTYYVTVKFKDISNKDVLLERSTHIFWNTNTSDMKQFEEELYMGIKRLIVFG